MNVLLLSMPDYFEHMPPVAVRMPNGALTSLAGNVDAHHKVAVADLILSHRQVRNTVTRLVREFDPDVVGLSVVEQVPDHLDPRFMGRFERGQPARPVVLARRSLDQMPA